ncbi:hypothetical protein Mal64_20310 [Pseudobythopirellula maris]|uniref:Uncharacterized protein n=1 Tax=Pseudobythopirellula maris TaxID=2527991 RepID=A0A5C5ZN14_9BACT|nr:hypothetical protein [Pseudobythopirellula maris]TWT88548.1 hypothetical protein Mal64_20310 [Pseudobythopirellula maris]
MHKIEISDEAYRALSSLHSDVPAIIETMAKQALEWQAQEVAAVQEGIDAYEAGDFEPWDVFSARMKAELGIPSDR